MTTVYCGSTTGRIFATVTPPLVVKNSGGGSDLLVFPPDAQIDDVTSAAFKAVAAHVAQCSTSGCACRGVIAAAVIRPTARVS